MRGGAKIERPCGKHNFRTDRPANSVSAGRAKLNPIVSNSSNHGDRLLVVSSLPVEKGELRGREDAGGRGRKGAGNGGKRFSRERNQGWRRGGEKRTGKERMAGGGRRGRKEGGSVKRARFTLQNDGGTRSKLGGAPDTTLPSENLANKRRKQERGETPWGGGVKVRAGNGVQNSRIYYSGSTPLVLLPLRGLTLDEYYG